MEKKILLDCRDVSLGYDGAAIWEGLTFASWAKTAPASPRC